MYGELRALRVADIEGYLRALDQVPANSADQKKLQLNLFIGLIA
ncbi:hypothetical protein ANO14919_140440 [Xylariales sp. No.14919]|nr:hypothetical protein ANO14919_140440 [Xylariales sp. No.14919]